MILQGSKFKQILSIVEKNLALHYYCDTTLIYNETVGGNITTIILDLERCKVDDFALKQWSLSNITNYLPQNYFNIIDKQLSNKTKNIPNYMYSLKYFSTQYMINNSNMANIKVNKSIEYG